MLVVDTNVLVHAANTDSAEHEACRAVLDRLIRSASPWYLTWGICYEFLRIVTHPRVLPNPWDPASALGFLRAVLAAPAAAVLSPTGRHFGLLAETLTDVPGVGGNLFHDTRTAVLMREHGIPTIVTRDADFHRFPFVTVRDPLSRG